MEKKSDANIFVWRATFLINDKTSSNQNIYSFCKQPTRQNPQDENVGIYSWQHMLDTCRFLSNG